MEHTESPPLLNADKAVIYPGDDRLGYAPFARTLADSIAKMAPPDGLVLAIYGPWGAGKTSVLQLVKYYLEQRGDEQPVIVQFNPWWFSGQEDLTRRFFEQLQAALSRWHTSQEVINTLAELAEGVSDLDFIPGAASLGKATARLLKLGNKDVPDLKEKVAQALRKQQKRILVIIDDVDRLTAEEIRQLFRVVKAVADFPNVVYLLSFDKEVVVRALAEAQGIPGEEYLEKIIQVPFELPLPEPTALQTLFLDKLGAIVGDVPDDVFDPLYFHEVYRDGISRFIDTPRDVVRLTNTLSVTYPAVKGDVNPTDFIAIETLRVFAPSVYDVIRRNLNLFSGQASNFHRPQDEEDTRVFHDTWASEIPLAQQSAVRHTLRHIFPRLEVVWGKSGYSAGTLSAWRRQLRLCSPEISQTYFRLAVPAGSIRNEEMQAFLALSENAQAFGARLLELARQQAPDGKPRVRAFLGRLYDYIETDAIRSNIQPILRALFDAGDELLLLDTEKEQIWEYRNAEAVYSIRQRLLEQLDTQQARFDVLRETITQGRAIGNIVRAVAYLGYEHGKYESNGTRSEEQRTVDAQQLATLESLAVQKVQDAAKQGTLINVPELGAVLYRWRDWSGDDVRQWVQKIVATDEGLVTFLEKMLNKVISTSGNYYRLDPEQLSLLLDTSKIVDRVRALSTDDSLTTRQRAALRQFLREYEMRQAGQEPDPWGMSVQHERAP